MTEMPSKRRPGKSPSQDRTDARDTRETIGLFYLRRLQQVKEDEEEKKALT